MFTYIANWFTFKKIDRYGIRMTMFLVDPYYYLRSLRQNGIIENISIPEKY